MSEKVKINEDLTNVDVPEEVLEAWDIVAMFLNSLPNLSFLISPWYEDGSDVGQKKYTVHAGGEYHRNMQIVSKSEWKSRDKQ